MSESEETAVNSPPVPNYPGDTAILRGIYRDLRIGCAVTMVMLVVAIIAERMSATRLQGALSEYYFTSAHSIFIATLLGTATLFFVYRGSSGTEDAFLTLAGVAAMIAALVPQERPETYGKVHLPKDFNIEAIIRPNVWAVVVALVLGWVLTLWQHRRKGTQPTRSIGETLALYLLRLIVVVGLITLVVDWKLFVKYAHGAAGVLMLSAFIATVFSFAYLARLVAEASPERRSYWRFYRFTGWTMLATIVVVVALHVFRPDWHGDLSIFIVETALILEFAVYWIVQTIDLWDVADISDLLPPAERAQLGAAPMRGGLFGLKSSMIAAKNAPAPKGRKLLRVL